MRQVGVWAVLVFILRPNCTWADQNTDDLIQKVERRYNGAKTLAVDFVEEYSVQGHRRPAESGKLTLRKQGKMRWDYAKPAGKLFVSDGKMVYLYTSEDNKVEEIPLKDTEDMRAPLAFLLGHLELKKEFRDFAVWPEGEERWLSANAKSPRSLYEKVEMLVNPDGAIKALVVFGRDASRLQFALSHEQLNPTVNDAFFAFRIPPGAEVVSALEYAGEGR